MVNVLKDKTIEKKLSQISSKPDEKEVNEWNKYLEKDLSNIKAYKTMLNTVKSSYNDLEWIKIGIVKEIDKTTENRKYKKYPEIATSFPQRINRKDNPVLIFKRRSNQKVYVADTHNIVYKLQEFQDQIEKNKYRIPKCIINDKWTLPLFSDLDEEITRLKEFNHYFVQNKIDVFIRQYYDCVKVIPLDKEDIYRPDLYFYMTDPNAEPLVKPFWMLIFSNGTYRILSLYEIEYGFEYNTISHFDMEKDDTVSERRRISIKPKFDKIYKYYIDCELIRKMLNLEKPEDVITKFYEDTLNQDYVENGSIVNSVIAQNYIRLHLKNKTSKADKDYIKTMEKLIDRTCEMHCDGEFEIIHVDEVSKLSVKQALVHIRFKKEFFHKEFTPDGNLDITHMLLPKIKTDSNGNRIITGFVFLQNGKEIQKELEKQLQEKSC